MNVATTARSSRSGKPVPGRRGPQGVPQAYRQREQVLVTAPRLSRLGHEDEVVHAAEHAAAVRLRQSDRLHLRELVIDEPTVNLVHGEELVDAGLEPLDH